MRDVTKDKFFEVIGDIDCHPTVTGTFPYTSIFKRRAGRGEVGRIVDSFPRVKGKVQSRYILVA